LGPNHEFKYMRRVLADPMLSSWTENINEVVEKGWYWEYKLDSCKVKKVESKRVNKANGYVEITASLKESGVMFGSEGKEIDRYKSRYNVTYHVVHEDGRWKINQVNVMTAHT